MIHQSGVSDNSYEVSPVGGGVAYRKFIHAAAIYGGFNSYNSALRDASAETVLRAMYDEVKSRDEKQDEDFLS